MPTLSKDTLAALFHEDHVSFSHNLVCLSLALGGVELVGPGWLCPFYRWNKQGQGLINWLIVRSSICCEVHRQCCLLMMIEFVLNFTDWASVMIYYCQSPLPFPKFPVLLFPVCVFILMLPGLESLEIKEGTQSFDYAVNHTDVYA